jgi:4-diphosphocytidyl-2-C-methyl-D-erythritol kinase
VQPVIADVLGCLRATGARLARMSGSGATCFAVYDGAMQAQAAAGALGASQPHWWIRAATLG